MDDERYGEGKGLSSGAETLGKTAIAAAGVRGIANGSAIANSVFVPVTGKFVAKKTRDLARGIKRSSRMLLMGLKPQVHYMV